MKQHVVNGLKVEEVARRVGVSYQTINRWYRFKHTNPDLDICALLPEYTVMDIPGGLIRVWDVEAVKKLKRFKFHITHGRCGIMGKYKGAGTKNGKNKIGNTGGKNT